MKKLLPLALLTLPLSACLADETISGYADTAATYRLQSMNGLPVAARATISFPEEGVVAGQAPCNSFSASQTAPYPWFQLGPMRVTRMACPNLDVEQAFFRNLAQMTLAEVGGAVLILSNEAGDEMVFQADPG